MKKNFSIVETIYIAISAIVITLFIAAIAAAAVGSIMTFGLFTGFASLFVLDMLFVSGVYINRWLNARFEKQAEKLGYVKMPVSHEMMMEAAKNTDLQVEVMALRNKITEMENRKTLSEDAILACEENAALRSELDALREAMADEKNAANNLIAAKDETIARLNAEICEQASSNTGNDEQASTHIIPMKPSKNGQSDKATLHEEMEQMKNDAINSINGTKKSNKGSKSENNTKPSNREASGKKTWKDKAIERGETEAVINARESVLNAMHDMKVAKTENELIEARKRKNEAESKLRAVLKAFKEGKDTNEAAKKAEESKASSKGKKDNVNPSNEAEKPVATDEPVNVQNEQAKEQPKTNFRESAVNGIIERIDTRIVKVSGVTGSIKGKKVNVTEVWSSRDNDDKRIVSFKTDNGSYTSKSVGVSNALLEDIFNFVLTHENLIDVEEQVTETKHEEQHASLVNSNVICKTGEGKFESAVVAAVEGEHVTLKYGSVVTTCLVEDLANWKDEYDKFGQPSIEGLCMEIVKAMKNKKKVDLISPIVVKRGKQVAEIYAVEKYKNEGEKSFAKDDFIVKATAKGKEASSTFKSIKGMEIEVASKLLAAVQEAV